MLNKKYGIIAIALVLVIAGGVAFTLGDSLSPEQFKAVDLDKHDFDVEETNQGMSGNVFLYSFKWDTYQESNEAYEMLEENSRVAYPTSWYSDCRASGESEATCKQNMEDFIVQRVISQRENERSLLKEKQAVTDYSDELTGSPVSIAKNELNAEQ